VLQPLREGSLHGRIIRPDRARVASGSRKTRGLACIANDSTVRG